MCPFHSCCSLHVEPHSLSLVCSALFPWTKRNSSRNGWEIQGKKERNGRKVFNFSSSSWDARGIKLEARAESRDKVGCVEDTIPKPRYILLTHTLFLFRARLSFSPTEYTFLFDLMPTTTVCCCSRGVIKLLFFTWMWRNESVRLEYWPEKCWS